MEKIVIATSISPKNIEGQKININSWIANGFSVISCNTLEEIAEIKPQFHEIKFVELARDAREECGKAVPYIYDILQALKRTGAKTCGIVNSDIYFYNMPSNICDFIKKETEESLLFIRRNEILEFKDISSMNFQYQPGGIDAFLFDRKLIDLFQDDGFAIAQAGWDFWIPCIADLNKIPVKEIANAINFHISHKIQWGTSFSKKKCEIFLNKYTSIESPKTLPVDEIMSQEHRRITNVLSNKLYCVSKDIYNNKIVIIGNEGTISQDIKDELYKFKSLRIYTEEEFENLKNEAVADIFIKLPEDTYLYSYSIKAIIEMMEIYNKDTIFSSKYFMERSDGILRYHDKTYLFERMGEVNKEQGEYLIASKNIEGLTTSRKENNFAKIPLFYKIISKDFSINHKFDTIKGKIAIIPAGFQSTQWVKEFSKASNDYNVVAVLDNNPEKWGQTVENFTIQGPEFLKRQDEFDQLLIVSLLYSDEIKKQVMEYLPNNKIITWF